MSQENLAIVLLVFSLWEIPWVRAAVAGVKFNLHWLKITEMTRTSSAVKGRKLLTQAMADGF